MIAWMGWELKNSGHDVDLSHLEADQIIPHMKIPLGSYAESPTNIKAKLLKTLMK